MVHFHRLQMLEVPVRMLERGGGQSSIRSGKSAYYMVKVLLAIFVGLLRARVPSPSPATRAGGREPRALMDAKLQILAIVGSGRAAAGDPRAGPPAAAARALRAAVAVQRRRAARAWPSGATSSRRSRHRRHRHPPNALFVIAFGFVLVLLLHFSIAVSRLADQSKVLAQRVALLEERLKRAQAERAGRGGGGGGAAAMTAATKLDGPIVIQPAVHGDERGFFCETWRESQMAELGIPTLLSRTTTRARPAGCCAGCTSRWARARPSWCAARAGRSSTWWWTSGASSPTYGGWEAFTLDDRDMRQLYVPIGFAHGFCVTSEVADVVYRARPTTTPSRSAASATTTPRWGSNGPIWSSTVSERDAGAPRACRYRGRTSVRLSSAGVAPPGQGRRGRSFAATCRHTSGAPNRPWNQ